MNSHDERVEAWHTALTSEHSAKLHSYANRTHNGLEPSRNWQLANLGFVIAAPTPEHRIALARNLAKKARTIQDLHAGFHARDAARR